MQHLTTLLLTAVIIFGITAIYPHTNLHAQSSDTKATTAPRPEGLPLATFAGGCFWCLESEIKNLAGVKFTRAGYTGGETDNPTYGQISSGKTGHAEAVQIAFDPGETDYETLVRFFLTQGHNPTQLNRQWVDSGTQYRSAIFYHNEEQKLIAEKVITELTKNKHFDKPIVTEIVPAVTFWDAEEYHQNYYEKYEQTNGYEHRRIKSKKQWKKSWMKK